MVFASASAIIAVAVEFKVTVSDFAFDVALRDFDMVDHGDGYVPSGRAVVLELNVVSVGNATVVAKCDPAVSSARGAYNCIIQAPGGACADTVNTEFSLQFVFVVTDVEFSIAQA